HRRDRRLDQVAGEVQGVRQDSAARSHPARLLEQSKSSLERARAVPLADLVKETSRMLPSLAKELGKSVPLVDCQDHGLVLTRQWADVVKDIFVHAFRNALAHGIEAADERTARGKNPQGTLRLRAEHNEHAILLR